MCVIVFSFLFATSKSYSVLLLPFGGAKINGWAKVFLFQVLSFVFARVGETNALYPCKKVTNRLRSLRRKVSLIYFRHFLYDFRTYFAHNLALYHTEKIVR